MAINTIYNSTIEDRFLWYYHIISTDGEIVVIAGDFNGDVGNNAEDYQDEHGAYGYGVRKRKGERILEFCANMNMTLESTLFKKRASPLITYRSGPSKTSRLVSTRDQRKFLKDFNVLPIEEFINQH